MQNPVRAREVRLGLVLYGGVSLCIYENGIVQEIYRAICGEGLYKLIGELIDSDIVVDVISGTSAGGVNGVMLAYALANKADFLQTAARWRQLGDIQALLRKADDETDTSLLDSKYYQDQLAACYSEALAPLSNPKAPDIGELDLFVTGTDAYGVISTVYDDLGHPIDVKNHRALFQLQYRGERKNDFKGCDGRPVTASDMATLSRLTSGFPVAFEPIQIGKKEDAPNFHRWGRLDGAAVYMDGGILNNKPFTSTIEAIASRTATREVERFLIYVEPSPETFKKSSEPPITPTVAEAGLWSLTSIPSYQSIASDLEAIQAHNERSLKVQKIVESLQPVSDDAGVDCVKNAKVVPELDDPCATGSHTTARLLLLLDAAVEAILNSPDGMRDLLKTEDLVMQMNHKTGKKEEKVMDRRRSGRLLVQSFWHWDGERNETLDKYDVFFRKRRVDYLTGVLMSAIKSTETPVEVPLEAWEAVNHFFKLYEITEWAMKTWLTQWTESDWEGLSEENPDLDTKTVKERANKLKAISEGVWRRAAERLDRLMTCAIEVPAFTFSVASSDGSVEARADLAKARKISADAREAYYGQLKGWMEKPIPGGSTNLLSRLDDLLGRAIREILEKPATRESGQLLLNEFCRFLDVDRQLLPIQFGSGFESTNVIRVVRFSPRDAQRGLSFGPVEDKVSGTALANFGAFFKKSWRAKDIMMGRFDAACLLTECLLTKERLTAVVARTGAPNQAAVAAMVARSLPNADPALTASITQYFATPTCSNWETMIDAIVLAAHEEIAANEWPLVAECALEQQYAWGQYQKEPSLPNGMYFPPSFAAGKSFPDQVLIRIAAKAISKKWLPAYEREANRKRPFLDEVPLTAMQEHASLAFVRLGKSLLASVPKGKARDTVEGSLIFKVTMQWVPGFFYRLVHTRRTQPDWMLVPIVVILNLALIVLLAFAWMLHLKQGLSLTYALLATAGVAAAALAEWALTRKNRWISIGGMMVAIFFIAVVGYGCGYLKVNHAQETVAYWDIAKKLLLSVLVIAFCGMSLFRHPVVRILVAVLAGVTLAAFIWK